MNRISFALTVILTFVLFNALPSFAETPTKQIICEIASLDFTNYDYACFSAVDK